VAILDSEGLPAVRLEAPESILGKGKVGRSLDGDRVVVPEADQLAESEMAGDGGGFAGNALHEIAVRADDVGAMIDHLMTRPVEKLRQPGLGDRHPYGVRDPLPQRP